MLKGRSREALAAFLLLLTFVMPASGDSPKRTFGDVVAQMYADKTFVVSPTSLNVDTFRGRSGKETAQMMSEAALLFYDEDALGETVALDYAGPYRLLLFLPRSRNDNPLQTFLRRGIWVPHTPNHMAIALPRLHVNSKEPLTSALKELGMRTAFAGNANFSPLLGGRTPPGSIGLLHLQSCVQMIIRKFYLRVRFSTSKTSATIQISQSASLKR